VKQKAAEKSTLEKEKRVDREDPDEDSQMKSRERNTKKQSEEAIPNGPNTQSNEQKESAPAGVNDDATPDEIQEQQEARPSNTMISDQNQWSPLKVKMSVGITNDRINETATRASLSGFQIDPRSYQSQLLQNLQAQTGSRIQYFTIRNCVESDESQPFKEAKMGQPRTSEGLKEKRQAWQSR